MDRVAVGETLEPLPLGPDDLAVVSVRKPVRWPVALMLAGMVAIALILPMRTQLAMSELVRLDRQFALSADIDQAGQQLVNRLAGATFPGDDRLIVAAETGIWRQEADLLAQVDRRVSAGVMFDGAVIAVRRQMHRYLQLRIDDLTAGRPDGPATRLELARVNSLLADQRSRFALAGPVRRDPRTAAVHLSIPATALAIAQRWLDQPTGVRLLAVANGIAELDVDASRIRPLSPIVPLDGQVVPRQGYIAYADGTSVTAWSPDWRGPPRVIGHGAEAFAASRPDAVWIVDHDTVREVDGQGRQLVRPAPTTGFISSVAVGDGIGMMTSSDGLIVWNPLSGRTTCRVARVGTPFAGNADVLAWVTPAGGLRLTRASTCTTTAVASPVEGDGMDYSYAGAGSLAPDGHALACFVSGLSPDLYQTSRLVTVDMTTGQVTMPRSPRVWARTVPIVWTADSQRIFYTVATQTGANMPATYQLGDPGTRVLRYSSPPAFWVMAMMPPG